MAPDPSDRERADGLHPSLARLRVERVEVEIFLERLAEARRERPA